MAREFNSFESLLMGMKRNIEKAVTSDRGIMEAAGHLVKRHAQAQLGHYLTESGPFPGEPWKQLADSTLARKEHDTPLVETGALHDAIEVHAENHRVDIGVKSAVGERGVDIGDIAVWQEFGTLTKGGHTPPRPFLGPALHENHEKIGKFIASAIFMRMR